MHQSDYCNFCDGQKAVYLRGTDGVVYTYWPGDSFNARLAYPMTCACINCGVAYSIESLATPVNILPPVVTINYD